MMNHLLNVMLVLSLVANLGMGVWLGRPESREPEVSEHLLQHRPLVPEERTGLVRSGSLKPSDEQKRVKLGVPWALAKESVHGPSQNQFEISQALISGLELTKEEKQAFERAMVALRSELRENELAGLQESDDHIIRVVLNEELQQATLGAFVKEIEEALPPSKAKILADVSKSDSGYLNWTSFELEVLDQKDGLYLKVSHLDGISEVPVGVGSEPVLRHLGGSLTNSLSSQDFARLRKRWGHMIDFDPLEAVMDQNVDE